jgi:Zn finger protein HypA/HybF involved in hydrogenase expression
MTATYTRIWCNECGDNWEVDRPFSCDDGDAAPPCPMCESEDTSPYGAVEEVAA